MVPPNLRAQAALSPSAPSVPASPKDLARLTELTQPSAVNHLAVRAVGSSFYCLVNGVLVGRKTVDPEDVPEGGVIGRVPLY